MSVYTVHSVKYLDSFKSTYKDGRPTAGEQDGLGTPWTMGACSACEAPVWFQPANRDEGACLVCWPCAGGIG